jgi:ferrochelatase
MTDAILVVGFGGPRSSGEIRPFLADVLRGRPVPPDKIDEVAHHYEVIGGRSPIIELTEAQVAGMTERLRRDGVDLPVKLAHRHAAPRLKEVLAELADAGAQKIVGLAMSAYDGPASSGRYEAAVAAACAELGERAPEVRWARGLRSHPGFVAAHAERIRAAEARAGADVQAMPLILTAHSVPVSAAAAYEAQLGETALAVATAAGRSSHRLCWQSRSGSPREPWLEPDVSDVIREEAARGARGVLVAPIGFLCDHVEVLYDLDVEAAATAREAGLAFHRAPALNDHPLFLTALADTVRAALDP